MQLSDLPAALNSLRALHPIVRGRVWDFASITIGEAGDGVIEGWLAVPKTNSSEEFQQMIKRGIPHHADFEFSDMNELEQILLGNISPQFVFHDEKQIKKSN